MAERGDGGDHAVSDDLPGIERHASMKRRITGR